MHIQFAKSLHERGMLVRRQMLIRKDHEVALMEHVANSRPDRIINSSTIDTVYARAEPFTQRFRKKLVGSRIGFIHSLTPKTVLALL
jgi:hypothetical protein